jgi:peptide/nickel transport system ATP-binding protein
MNDVLIETQELCKYFKTRNGLLHAVDHVDVAIPKGRTLGVVGESGCGKTTLGRLMVRLLEPTSGDILYKGNSILSLSEDELRRARQKIQIIFQDPYASLNPRMTVRQIIAEPLRAFDIMKERKALDKKVTELMDTVGLAQRFRDSYPHELDGGRRQRVGIARALSVNPEFVVCDEPVSALDVSIQAQILNLLMDLQESSVLTYMFISHDLSVVRHISSEVMVMYLGQCVETAPTHKLFENPLHPYTKALLEAIPIPRLRDRPKRSVIKGEVTSPVNPKPGCRFAPRCPIVTDECTAGPVPLREVAPRHLVACVRL